MNRTIARHILAGTLLTLVTVGCRFDKRGNRPLLVADGSANAEIVIAESPTRSQKLAARELRDHIRLISGADLPIVSKQSGNHPLKIYVGASPFTESLGLKAADLDHGAFRMLSGDDYLVLFGRDDNFVPKEPWPRNRKERDEVLWAKWDAITGETWENPMKMLYKAYNKNLDIWKYDEKGSMNAVHEFLRRLGVRWYMPGSEGTIVPEMASIELPEVDETVRPDFALRAFSQSGRNFFQTTDDEVLWQLRLGLNDAYDVLGGATGHGTVNVHARKEVQKKHPDYYALWGKRAVTAGHGGGKPCLSSKGLFRDNVKYARAVFDQYDSPMVSIMPADGYSYICQCDLCEGKDTPERGARGRLSDYVWSYVNGVAKELNETHPDRKVCCFAYGSYLQPPLKIDKLSPNVVVGICQWRSMFHNREIRGEMLDLRRRWLEKTAPGAKLIIWDYYLHSRPNRGWDAIPAVYPHLIAEDLKSLKGISIGDYIEVMREPPGTKPNHLALNHLNLYFTARLYWNADRDVDPMLDEYYRLFYGPVAEEAKELLEFCENNWFKMKSDVESVNEMFDLLAQAREKAGDTIYGDRLALIADYVAPLREKVKEIGAGGGKTFVDRPNARRASGHTRPRGDLVIDGDLNDKFWVDQPKYMLNDCVSGEVPENNRTCVKVGWTDDALVIGLRCYDDDMKNLNVTSKQNDHPPIWYGDVVDIFLETHDHAFYQIGVNPAGAMADADREKGVDLEWTSGAEVATHHHDNRWTAEILIPFVPHAGGRDVLQGVDAVDGLSGTKPTSSMPWFFNVCRQRVRGDGTGDKNLQAFSATGKPAFAVREKFGELYAE